MHVNIFFFNYNYNKNYNLTQINYVFFIYTDENSPLFKFIFFINLSHKFDE